MRNSTRSALYACIAAMAGVALCGAGFEMLSAFGMAWRPIWHGIPLVAAGSVLGVIAIGWIAIGVIDGHFDDIERVRAVALTGHLGEEAMPRPESPELERLVAALSVGMRVHDAAEDGGRLTALLAAFDEPLLAITEAGQISLVNGAAKALLGRAGVGSSILGIFDGAALEATLSLKAGEVSVRSLHHLDGRRLTVRMVALPDTGGALLRFAGAVDSATPGEVEHDLRLHDLPPPGGFTDETPLECLPTLVFDSETTGLDVRTDRVVAMAGLRLHGRRSYPATRFEELVNPGRPIPPRATAIHAIGDAMVEVAPRFDALWPDLLRRWAGTVVVGHNIGFDLAILGAETARAGLAWQAPPHLCTLLLAAALWPSETDLNLESVASRLAVAPHGRHTALGDALMTAAVWAGMIPLLADRGVHTLADARRFSERAKSVRRLQRAAGW